MTLVRQRPVRYGGVVAGQEELAAVAAVVAGQNWASGDVVREFEMAAAAVQGRRHAVFVNSGSSALLLALSTLPRGSRVAMPALQFATLYGAAVWCGLQPVLVDSDDSLNMSPAALAATPGLDAVAFVHVAGNPANAAQIGDLCLGRGIPMIEDICEAFGGRSQGAMAGNSGQICATSTHAAHQISTGEGGLAFTDDDDDAARMRAVRDWGRSDPAALPAYYPGYVHGTAGLNLHASDIHAALGLVQLRRLPGFVAARAANHRALTQAVQSLRLPVTLPRRDVYCAPSWYTFAMLCDDRDALMKHLDMRGIESRPLLAGNMARQPVTAGQYDPSRYPVADGAYRRGLWVSVHPALSADDVGRIIAALEEFFT